MTSWLVPGDAFPPVYHGARRKVRNVDPAELQKRDPGFYGRGFYVTTARHYARAYGHIISEYRFAPEAVVLDATLRPDEASPAMVEAVVGHVDRKWREAARARDKEGEFDEELTRARREPLAWRDALNEYARDLDVDAVAFSRGEIVVLKPNSLVFVR